MQIIGCGRVTASFCVDFESVTAYTEWHFYHQQLRSTQVLRMDSVRELSQDQTEKGQWQEVDPSLPEEEAKFKTAACCSLSCLLPAASLWPAQGPAPKCHLRSLTPWLPSPELLEEKQLDSLWVSCSPDQPPMTRGEGTLNNTENLTLKSKEGQWVWE